MDESQPLLFVLSLTTLTALILTRLFPRAERLAVFGSWCVHMVSALSLAAIYLYHYGGGDITLYTRTGMELAAVWRQNPLGFAPDVLALLFHRDIPLPIDVFGIGTSTGSMAAFSAVISFFFGGGLFTAGIVYAFGAYVGKVLLYSTFRERLVGLSPWQLRWATLFIPSYVFWSSGPLKESVAILGLGVFVFGLSQLGRLPVRAILIAAVGATAIGLVKPYILLAAGCGVAAWSYSAYASRATGGRRVHHNPIALAGAVLLGALALIGVGSLFESLSLDKVAETTSFQQEASLTVEANSNYSVGNASESDRTVLGQLAFAPVALFFALFRPFPTDVNNALMAVNALETLWVSYLFVRLLVRGRRAFLIDNILANPWLTFCAVFTIVLGVGVGLATTNMGTLSRYRIPLMPFFVVLLFALGNRETVAQAGVAPLRRSHA